MTDNHTPLPTAMVTSIPATHVPAASVPNSGISDPSAYVAVAGGYASVGGPGFPIPAVPTALPLSSVSGDLSHAYATPIAGAPTGAHQPADFASRSLQTTSTMVPTVGYQGGGVATAVPGVVGGHGVNGATVAAAGVVAQTVAPAVAPVSGVGIASVTSSSPNGAATSGGSGKSSLKRGASSIQSKPQSAWMLFIQDRREQVKIDNPDIAVTQQQKIMSEMWKTMSGNEKEAYLSRAREDQKRYKAGMAEKATQLRTDGVYHRESVGTEPIVLKSLQPAVKKEDFYSNDERGQSTELVCPLGRIQRIIKLDQDVQSVTKEAAALIGKAMELFTALLAKEAFLVSQSQNRRLLKLQDITDIMHNQDQFYWIKDDFPLPPR